MLQSPSYLVNNSRAFRWCVWSRLGPGSPASVALSLTMVGISRTATGSTTTSIAGTPGPGQAPGDGDTSPWPMVVTSAWKRFCLADAQSRSTINVSGQFQLALGLKVGTFYFDDFTIEWNTLDTNYMSPTSVAARIDAYRRWAVRNRWDECTSMRSASSACSAEPGLLRLLRHASDEAVARKSTQRQLFYPLHGLVRRRARPRKPDVRQPLHEAPRLSMWSVF